MDIAGIYQIRNLINDKIYIGSAININKRWFKHKTYLRQNIHNSKYLQRAWNKYTEPNFLFEVLEIVNDKNKLIDREQHYLDFFKSYNSKIGYNICSTAGNSLNTKHTEESKLKMRLKKLGTKASSETKHKMSQSRCGENNGFYHKKHTKEARAKMGKRGIEHPFYGKSRSIETRQKISSHQKGKCQNNPTHIRYWVDKGYSKDDALKIIRQKRSNI